jgi:predicted tellurium resistance membrane protein TerC
VAGGATRKEDKGAAQQQTLPVRFLKWAFKGVAPDFSHVVGDRFFGCGTKRNPKRGNTASPCRSARHFMTSAVACLLVIERSDTLLATVCMPSMIAVTTEPLIVYTEMIFAVLGLRPTSSRVKP